jgi:hypothetical protein
VSEAAEAIPAALGECSMQDPANGLRRIPIPRTRVNSARLPPWRARPSVNPATDGATKGKLTTGSTYVGSLGAPKYHQFIDDSSSSVLVAIIEAQRGDESQDYR